MTAKNPRKWTTRTRPSNFARSDPIALLILKPKRITPQKSSVPCQFSMDEIYSGCVSKMSPWIIVPVTYPPEATRACHPVKVSQAVRYPRNLREDGDASMETQWYCPPDVGAIKISSESVAKTESIPAQTTRNP